MSVRNAEPVPASNVGPQPSLPPAMQPQSNVPQGEPVDVNILLEVLKKQLGEMHFNIAVLETSLNTVKKERDELLLTVANLTMKGK